ncbi:MAG TPA: hypothetical protein VKE26_26030 [Xanthobacteraceae bacterium]|nr:hypothetical protein [Xanthobacteraceae bacterium]
MTDVSRRTFIGGSVGALTLAGAPAALAAAQCVTGPLPGFLPSRLTVDCASQRNFQVFRKNDAYLGLAGAVSMTFVRSKVGSYQAGNLFLFPWLKKKGAALGAGKTWDAVVPTGPFAYKASAPVPAGSIPADEYFCSVLLQAPTSMFIGFAADVPFSALEARLGLFTNVDQLADGKAMGIDWASSNLNNAWFGGSRSIPDGDTCNGAAWRRLIVDGLNQASMATC